MKSYVILFALFLNLYFFSSCTSQEKTPEQPNIVWITSEDNSTHYMKLFDDNGITTPNIESLAEQGLVFTHAFSNAAVCSAARSTLISGCYGPRIASHYHRRIKRVDMPDGLKMFPAYLRDAGYYTTNHVKEDYNINKPDGVWDESSRKATWKNRQEGQPFFHVFNILTTHESCLHFPIDNLKPTITTLNSFEVNPTHPNTELFKYTNAYYRDRHTKMDQLVGAAVQELKDAGLYESTFIFYYGDHGGVLPGSKGYLYETGVHVPLVVHIPEKYKHLVDITPGTKVEGFVSFVDFGATVLSLAGVPVPEGMDGVPFLGAQVKTSDLGDVTYSYADRFDEKYDMVRAVRKGKYKYIRNYQPFNPDALFNEYRYKQHAYKEWKQLYKEGKLNDVQSRFFEVKSAEMLFDIEADPYETINLAQDPEHKETLLQLRKNLNSWMMGMPDLSFYPEFYLINNAFDDPTAFGQQHKADISKYSNIADLSLSTFDAVQNKIATSLNSEDEWSRYWAIIVCSSFGEDALELAASIKEISTTDPIRINRVRAAEFLALTGKENPAEVILSALYKAETNAEALLMLNTMTMLFDTDYNYTFDVDKSKMIASVAKDKEVDRRIRYLNGEI